MSELATQRQANARQRIAAFDADLAVRLAADSSLPAPISEDTLMRLHERLLARYCVACLSSLRREMFVTAGHWGDRCRRIRLEAVDRRGEVDVAELGSRSPVNVDDGERLAVRGLLVESDSIAALIRALS